MTKNKAKLQSAMEYLMTYGWAILIIAVVLTALFTLGVFSGSSLLPTACIAASGYLCQGVVYHDGGLGFTFGQSTGSSWTNAFLTFVPSGTSYDANIPANAILQTPFASGSTTPITINTILVGGSSVVGSSLTGYLYASYQTSDSSPVYTAQVATVVIKAT